MIGLVFLVVAVPKLRDAGAFRSIVAADKSLPEALVTPVARTRALVELAIGLMLVGDTRRFGGVSIDLPTTVHVPEDDSARGPGRGSGPRDRTLLPGRPLSDGFPSVVVLDESGGVLASGSPSSAAEREFLVRSRQHSQAPSLREGAAIGSRASTGSIPGCAAATGSVCWWS